ncbi:hypothetical protein [Vibrio coralliilyticus]|uniref:Lipoprotein n=1 Tax=Vibrio coralliilyticus TaxID=190893 RepID=A0AAP6ZUG5_9VIBR|nr:hypothetical protein [Vibrio coralliilyticus]NOI31848.1 hypothetical protein [Vibrio coralliilyticus]NOJ25292.1 hypothetical protein [Vibrio coralliilyticus]
MKNVKKMGCLVAIVGSLLGCQSTQGTIEPRDFQERFSEAYNIANQTTLTRNNSPLKDFSINEIEEMKTAMAKNSGGDASILFGTLSILTGNFTGVIDVVGGNAANLANSNHTAAYSRWFVEIPMDKAGSSEEAWWLAAKAIRQAQIEVYSQFGEVKVESKKEGIDYLSINLDGKDIALGGALKHSNVGKGVIASEGFYRIGYTDTSFPKFVMPSSPLAIYLENQSVDPMAVYKKISNKLPKGYYLYIPSFEKQYLTQGTYIDLHHTVPSIYSSGEKYDFIQP